MERTTANRRTVPMATEIHTTLETPGDVEISSKKRDHTLVSHNLLTKLIAFRYDWPVCQGNQSFDTSFEWFSAVSPRTLNSLQLAFYGEHRLPWCYVSFGACCFTCVPAFMYIFNGVYPKHRRGTFFSFKVISFSIYTGNTIFEPRNIRDRRTLDSTYEDDVVPT